MATYRLGSSGEEVRQIQVKLQTQGLYRGPIDGAFGGGTEAAVKTFQQKAGLEVDGAIGPITWKALFNAKIPAPSLFSKPLAYRCLALTGAFETNSGFPDCFAGLSGNFDGQGISFGVCQWNFGQGSLQPLLKEMIVQHPDIVQSIFRQQHDVLTTALNGGKRELMSFAASIQHPVRHTINEPWRGMFKSLGRTGEFQTIEQKYAATLYQSALDLCSDFGLWSQRAAALMFDIKVQNGSIRDLTRAQILADFASLATGLPRAALEMEKMKIVANRRAEAANSRWVEDVRTRKLCIANGEGIVHGVRYNLEEQFGITLTK
ncbi:peptidoglycan-binding domain 1 protein [Sulfuricella denitrificans skB26]|uniref:Peptidoglycan-binding domain 1 protein n=1 Tax=Sulfuricella denitrificans (strain DSM 22764 / NBRC 105220 / skB26) TaxID=1163617 RepID=S6AI64_SULDS|nr:peptidoglycan-binding domain-containing protein [Sulfuricella denitrificans]BAN35901.1 peptidoglycan-binding domain 1 protein [Sulfuricella denitrificans skB26]